MQASAAKAVQASQMHTRSRTVTELIQEAHTEASTLQGELEAAEGTRNEAVERVKIARSSHENLDELLAVAANARLVDAAVSRAHDAARKACFAAETAEAALACKRDDIERVQAQSRLMARSGAALHSDESVTGTGS